MKKCDSSEHKPNWECRDKMWGIWCQVCGSNVTVMDLNKIEGKHPGYLEKQLEDEKRAEKGT